MIKLRRLEKRDVPFMLEWMHDDDSKKIFQNNFKQVNENKAMKFIENSYDEFNQHFAIYDDNDNEYLGTISLKKIDSLNKNAEYAISTRKKIRGRGISKIATEILLNYAFKSLNLHKVYLCVLSTNITAKKFYYKCGFIYEGTFKDHVLINGKLQDLEWYAIYE